MSALLAGTGLGGAPRRADGAPLLVGVVRGEGVGPEVVGAALAVLEAVAAREGLSIVVRETDAERSLPPDPLGSLPGPVAEFAASIFDDGGALLCGAKGGRFVYDLRARFDLFCKLVPIRPAPALADASIVRPQRLDGVDVLLVRENVGGIYLGEWRRRNGVAEHRFTYSAEQVARIVTVAATLARARRGKLTVVVKSGGVPAASALWAEQALATTSAAGVEVEVLEADNAGYQLVAEPGRFDVVVAPNLLGDLLADSATVLLGSRGLSYSANFGPEGRAVYQTGHGAAKDLTASDRANPVAQILSTAMMLRETFALPHAAARIEHAVESVLAAGLRTADLAAPGCRVVGTRELARRIADEASRR
jgi:3-isopropylmalate dehydrogenase